MPFYFSFIHVRDFFHIKSLLYYNLMVSGDGACIVLKYIQEAIGFKSFIFSFLKVIFQEMEGVQILIYCFHPYSFIWNSNTLLICEFHPHPSLQPLSRVFSSISLLKGFHYIFSSVSMVFRVFHFFPFSQFFYSFSLFLFHFFLEVNFEFESASEKLRLFFINWTSKCFFQGLHIHSSCEHDIDRSETSTDHFQVPQLFLGYHPLGVNSYTNIITNQQNRFILPFQNDLYPFECG